MPSTEQLNGVTSGTFSSPISNGGGGGNGSNSGSGNGSGSGSGSDTVFDSLRFYIDPSSGDMDEMQAAVRAGGGRTQAHFDFLATHAITRETELLSLADENEADAVRPEWLYACLKAGTLLPVAAFSPCHGQLRGARICTANIGSSDRAALEACVTFYGGKFDRVLRRDTTVLLFGSGEGASAASIRRAVTKVKRARAAGIKIVRPHWALLTAKHKQRLPLKPFLVPLEDDATLLNATVPVVEVTAAQQKFVESEPTDAVKGDKLVPGQKKASSIVTTASAATAATAAVSTTAEPMDVTVDSSHGGVVPTDPLVLEADEVSTEASIKAEGEGINSAVVMRRTRSTTATAAAAAAAAVADPLLSDSGDEVNTQVPLEVLFADMSFLFIDNVPEYIELVCNHGGAVVQKEKALQSGGAAFGDATHIISQWKPAPTPNIGMPVEDAELVNKALDTHKPVVTLAWLEDCLAHRSVVPPLKSLHRPVHATQEPLSGSKAACTGFIGDARSRVHDLVDELGGAYSVNFTARHLFLIAVDPRAKSAKISAARKWKRPVLPLRWLSAVHRLSRDLAVTDPNAPRVCLTGLGLQQDKRPWEMVVNRLGGRVVSALHCTHVVGGTDGGQTESMLLALSVCREVLHVSWLKASAAANKFVAPDAYRVRSVRNWGYDPVDTLKRRDALLPACRIFTGCVFVLNRELHPHRSILGPLVQAHGGHVVTMEAADTTKSVVYAQAEADLRKIPKKKACSAHSDAIVLVHVLPCHWTTSQIKSTAKRLKLNAKKSNVVNANAILDSIKEQQLCLKGAAKLI